MNKKEIIYEYFDNENFISQKENYEAICSKINKRYSTKSKILNMAAMLFIVFIFGISTSIYAKRDWNIEYKEYENRSINHISASLETSKIENLEMEYSYQNGIGVKIDSIVKTPDTLRMNINFDIDNFSNINTDTLSFGYAVFDEKNNIYNVSERLKLGAGEKWTYKQKLCKELNLKYKPSKFLPNVLTNGGKLPTIIKSEAGNIIFEIEDNSYIGYPESKKLYIRVFDIGFVMSEGYVKENREIIYTDIEDFELSNCEWQFEIEIPKEFYKDSFIELKSLEELEDFDIKRATLSETALVLEINHNYSLIDNHNIRLVDETGNSYLKGIGSSDDNMLKMIFNVNKNDFKESLILKIEDIEQNIKKEIKLIKK